MKVTDYGWPVLAICYLAFRKRVLLYLTFELFRANVAVQEIMITIRN